MLSKALAMLNRLGKRKETDGLRFSSKLEQWKLPSEGTDEETRSVGWELLELQADQQGTEALIPQRNCPKLQGLAGLQWSWREGFNFLEFHSPFCFLFWEL